MGTDRLGYHPVDTAPATHDLDAVIALVRQVRDRHLERPTVRALCDALAVGMRPNSVKNKLYSAAKYGLLGVQANPHTKLNEISLLPLGEAVLDPARAREAKVRAFLNVPVHRAIFLHYRNRPLPSHRELEHFLAASLHLTSKHLATARQIFLRAAEQAGFFEYRRDRLVVPAGIALPPDLSLPDAFDVSRPDAEDVVQHERLATQPDDSPVVATAPVMPQPVAYQGSPWATVIEWWWQKKPSAGEPETRWRHWQQTLDDILALEFSGERTE